MKIINQLNSNRKVEVVNYQSNWQDDFHREANLLKDILSSHVREIYHIGSTAIPAMPAKPVIDILLVCENLDDIDAIKEKLKLLQYFDVRRHVIPHRSFFTRKQQANKAFHLHIRERGDPQINRHVNFKDYLIHYPQDAKRYADLKLQLARLFVDDINSYVMGKDSFIQEIDNKAKQWELKKKDYLMPNTGPFAHEWSQEKLTKAMEANLNVHMTYFAQYLQQVELIRIPGITLVNSRLLDDTFNYVLEADFLSDYADQNIQEVTHHFRDQHVPFSWWISPHDQPNDLSSYLEKNSYINTENNVAMYFDLDAWDGKISTSPELEIIQAKDEKTLQDFALVLANDVNSFKQYFKWIAAILTEEDPIEYYVGYVNGKPVVRGLACYFAQLAGLHWLSTVPSERKKGYGRAMQEYRLKRAKELGYHIAVLQASSEGYSLYKKMGYRECGVFKEYKLNI